MEQQRSLSEIQIQQLSWQTIWREIPELRRCFFHVPNESTYDNSQQASSGVIPGIQDMMLLCRKTAYLIELKDDTGKIDIAQKVAHAAHAAQGFTTWVFYNAPDCIAFIRAIWDKDQSYDFTQHVSEFSNPDLLDSLIAEMQAKKKLAKERKQARASQHNNNLRQDYKRKFG